jgi:hypothetical protein
MPRSDRDRAGAFYPFSVTISLKALQLTISDRVGAFYPVFLTTVFAVPSDRAGAFYRLSSAV